MVQEDPPPPFVVEANGKPPTRTRCRCRTSPPASQPSLPKAHEGWRAGHTQSQASGPLAFHPFKLFFRPGLDDRLNTHLPPPTTTTHRPPTSTTPSAGWDGLACISHGPVASARSQRFLERRGLWAPTPLTFNETNKETHHQTPASYPTPIAHHPHLPPIHPHST